jgi:hypothetical protein
MALTTTNMIKENIKSNKPILRLSADVNSKRGNALQYD